MHRTRKLVGLALLLCLVIGFIAYQLYNPKRHVIGYSVYGIDVSRWQFQVDWNQVRNDQIQFAFIKATQGVHSVDSFFLRNWEMTDSLKIPRGAYHYYQPEQDPIQQVQNFIKRIDILSMDLPPVIDLEEPILDKKKFRVDLQLWLDSVGSHFHRKPLLYCSRKYYQSHLEKHFSGYPLWIAQYKRYPYPKVVNTWEQSPKTITKRGWLIWQFSQTGRVKGIDGNVDLDVFAGDYEDFMNWVNSR